ncbi:MAG: hypothetical protein HOC78_01885 [Candidatus Komeilibacteria bacterium]|jgi:hypothetical protein|nr:hypothetical protein [Candidatus Komeilibacteria bacterium]
MKKYILTIIMIIILGLSWQYKNRQPDLIELDLPVAKKHQEFVEPAIEDDTPSLSPPKLGGDVREDRGGIVESEVEVEQVESISVNLAVPFTSQAPTADWEQPYQDACEEASLLMVDYYYANQDFPTKEEVENILLEMVAWQEINWGGHFNLPTASVAEYAMTTFGYRVEVIEDLTADKIRVFLNRGIPVIIPADGHKLDNPFFSGNGPEYHMLVVKGYQDDKFITNDPGTRRGADFIYTEKNLMASIFDWDTKKDQTIGPKRGLVLYND